MVSSGYAGVWAADNTREAIFDAMMRKETYATTGPRMIVRFFGGWDFEAKDAQTRNPAVIGYGKGVPMGGDLRTAAAGKAPTFLVAALKDPIGGNLDRIQIVKGWVDAAGQRQEKLFDVAWSGDRKPGADGKLPLVGNTVDVAEATWTNTIGASELITVWRDPEFNPALRAVYYARVLEIPTPRWTAYEAKRFNIKMPARGADGDAGTRLHVADLVHAVRRLLKKAPLLLGAALIAWSKAAETQPRDKTHHPPTAAKLRPRGRARFLVLVCQPCRRMPAPWTRRRPKPPTSGRRLLAICGPGFSDEALLRRHPFAHLVLLRCRCGWGTDGSCGMRTVSREARRSLLLLANRQSCHARSTFSSLRTTPTTWAGSLTCLQGSQNCLRARPDGNGTIGYSPAGVEKQRSKS